VIARARYLKVRSERASACERDAVLRNPFTPEHLLATIVECLDRPHA
jgi:hypothetical protein